MYQKEAVLLSNIRSLSFLKFSLILGIIFLLMHGFERLMRNYLQVEKRPSFSYNHVNEKHKKIDWRIRITFLVTLLISYFDFSRNSFILRWYFNPGFLMVLFLVASETTRAFMEWKYGENPRTYILTLSQLIFALILLSFLWIIITSNILNIF